MMRCLTLNRKQQVDHGMKRSVALLVGSRAKLYEYDLCWFLTRSVLNRFGWPCTASLVPLEAASKLVSERPSRNERATPTISEGSAGCPVQLVSPWRNIYGLHLWEGSLFSCRSDPGTCWFVVVLVRGSGWLRAGG